MSIRAVRLVQGVEELTLAEYVVLISIASHADKVGWRCRQSLSQLAKASNLYRATTVRAVQRLLAPYAAHEPRSLMCVVNDGTNDTNTYVLNFELLSVLKKQRRKKGYEASVPDGRVGLQGVETKSLSPRAHAGVGVVTTPARETNKSDLEASKRAKVPTARSEAKKFVREQLEIMAQLTDEALSRLAGQIAVRHPRSRLRNLAIDGVGESERAAILKAMGEEAILRHINMAAAGRAMLSRLDEWDSIPRSEWELAVEIPQFYELKHHHREPRELIRTLQGAKEQTAKMGDSAVETKPQLSSILPRRREVAPTRHSVISQMVAVRRSQAPKERNLFR